MSKRRKNGNVVKFPVRRAGATAVDPGRKLSDILKQMALRLVKSPDAVHLRPTIETALLLATAAWNSALGHTALRNRYRDILAKIDWDGAVPWAELRSADGEQLVAELIEYKRAHYPGDRRLILGVGLSPEDQIQVQWENQERLVAPFAARSGAAAAPQQRNEPLAEKIIARMKREVHGKITNLKAVIAGRTAAKELQKTVASREALAALHPAHAAYVYAQNQVSVLAEELSGLDELAPLAKMISEAEDTYLPSGPPMSPLTKSYFSCWSSFDACVGVGDETIGTTILRVCGALGMDRTLLGLIQLMQDSRMGVYGYEGREGDLAVLRELATDTVHRAIVPSGYRGQQGELWYARVLPPPLPGGAEHVVLTTPYVLLKPGPREWLAYFDRIVAGASRQAYERHMKYGPTLSYWNEFVFEAYMNHQTEAIFLAGLPDVAESRPHSRVNS